MTSLPTLPTLDQLPGLANLPSLTQNTWSGSPDIDASLHAMGSSADAALKAQKPPTQAQFERRKQERLDPADPDTYAALAPEVQRIAQQPGGISSSGALTALGKALDVVDAPRMAVAKLLNVAIGAKASSPDPSILGGDRIYGADVMKRFGVESRAGQLIGGFAWDVLTDPITWATGLGGILRQAGKLAVGGVTRAVAKGVVTDLANNAGVKLAENAGIHTLEDGAGPALRRVITKGKMDGLVDVLSKIQEAAQATATATKDASWIDRANAIADAAKGQRGEDIVQGVKRGLGGSEVEQSLSDLVSDMHKANPEAVGQLFGDTLDRAGLTRKGLSFGFQNLRHFPGLSKITKYIPESWQTRELLKPGAIGGSDRALGAVYGGLAGAEAGNQADEPAAGALGGAILGAMLGPRALPAIRGSQTLQGIGQSLRTMFAHGPKGPVDELMQALAPGIRRTERQVGEEIAGRTAANVGNSRELLETVAGRPLTDTETAQVWDQLYEKGQKDPEGLRVYLNRMFNNAPRPEGFTPAAVPGAGPVAGAAEATPEAVKPGQAVEPNLSNPVPPVKATDAPPVTRELPPEMMTDAQRKAVDLRQAAAEVRAGGGKANKIQADAMETEAQGMDKQAYDSIAVVPRPNKLLATVSKDGRTVYVDDVLHNELTSKPVQIVDGHKLPSKVVLDGLKFHERKEFENLYRFGDDKAAYEAGHDATTPVEHAYLDAKYGTGTADRYEKFLKPHIERTGALPADALPVDVHPAQAAAVAKELPGGMASERPVLPQPEPPPPAAGSAEERTAILSEPPAPQTVQAVADAPGIAPEVKQAVADAAKAPPPVAYDPLSPEAKRAVEYVYQSRRDMRSLFDFAREKGVPVEELQSAVNDHLAHIRTLAEERKAHGFAASMKEFFRGGKPGFAKQREIPGSLVDINAQRAAQGKPPLFAEDPVAIDSLHAAALTRAIGKADTLEQICKRLGKDLAESGGKVPEGLVRAPARLAKFWTGVDHYAFTPELVADMERLAKLWEKPRGLLAAFDAVQNAWKGIALLAPAYHGRNAFGTVWMSAAGDGLSVGESVRGVKSMFDRWSGKATSGLLDNAIDAKLVNPATGAPWTRRQIIDETGIAGQGFYAEGMEKAAVDGALKEHWTRYFSPAAWLQFNRKLGTAIQGGQRLGHIITRMKAGDTLGQAVASASKYLHDYTKATPFERNVMMRIFPFYQWARNNIELQFGLLVDRPEFAAAMAKGKGDVEGSLPEGQVLPDSLRPDYNRREAAFQMSGGLKPTYMNLPNVAPLGDLMAATPAGAAQLAIGLTTPFVTIPYQLATNKDQFFNKPIRRFEGQTVRYMGMEVPPEAAFVARSVRPVNEVQRMVSGIQQGEGPVEIMGRLAGARVFSGNLPAQIAQHERAVGEVKGAMRAQVRVALASNNVRQAERVADLMEQNGLPEEAIKSRILIADTRKDFEEARRLSLTLADMVRQRKATELPTAQLQQLAKAM